MAELMLQENTNYMLSNLKFYVYNKNICSDAPKFIVAK